MAYTRDLLTQLRERKMDRPLREMMRPAYIVHGTKKVDELLRELQREKVTIAVVVDEYGGTDGLVTMEDLIEEIVGDLDDELHHDEAELKMIDERTSVVEGQMRVEDVNEELDLSLPQGDYETLAGFILERLGRLPDKGDSVTYNGVRMTVLEMQGPRIKQIEIRRV